MICPFCERRFGVAGNIRNYKIKCPHCGENIEDYENKGMKELRRKK